MPDQHFSLPQNLPPFPYSFAVFFTAVHSQGQGQGHPIFRHLTSDLRHLFLEQYVIFQTSRGENSTVIRECHKTNTRKFIELPAPDLRPLAFCYPGKHICSARLRSFLRCASSGVIKRSALVGQALTQAGIPLSRQRSHLTTTLLPGLREMAPKGQANSQKPHPIQRRLLCCTVLVPSSQYMALVGQTRAQKASSQCRQLTGTEHSSAA